VLANEAVFNALKNAAARLQEWRVLAAILMPDHLHAVVAPSERVGQLGNFSAALKRWMRKELDASWEWQRRCLTACYAPKSRFMRNGFMSRRTRFAQALLRIGETGRTDLSSMRKNNSLIHISAWQAMRLPYNLMTLGIISTLRC
jgi:REP element-mobilizing transposase RayT